MELFEETGLAGGIDVTDLDGYTLVRLWGEIDGALREQASESMAQAMASTEPVVVDVAGVTFIDSSGLAFLLQLNLAAAETGQRMTVRDPNRVVADLLAMIGMGDELDIQVQPTSV